MLQDGELDQMKRCFLDNYVHLVIWICFPEFKVWEENGLF